MKYFVFILFIFTFLANTFEVSCHEDLVSNSTVSIEKCSEDGEGFKHSKDLCDCACHGSSLNIIDTIAQKSLAEKVLFEKELAFSPVIQKLSDYSSQDIRPPIS